jgi:hypothetical protein
MANQDIEKGPVLIAFDDLAAMNEDGICMPKFRIQKNKKGGVSLIGENIFKYSSTHKSYDDAVNTLLVVYAAAKRGDYDRAMVVNMWKLAERGVPVYL